LLKASSTWSERIKDLVEDAYAHRLDNSMQILSNQGIKYPDEIDVGEHLHSW